MTEPTLILPDDKATLFVTAIPHNDEYHYEVTLNVKYLLKALNITIEEFAKLIPLMDITITQKENK